MKEAVRFVAEGGVRRIEEFREERPGQLGIRARPLMPELVEILGNLQVGRYSACAKLHIPRLEELLDKHEMGGRAWRNQFTGRFLMLGYLAEVGAYPVHSEAGARIDREELFHGARSRVKFSQKCAGDGASELLEEA